MSLITTLEDDVKAFVDRVDGEAVKVAEEVRDKALATLAEVKAGVAKVGPFADKVKAVLEADAAAVAPELKAAIEGLVAEVESLLGKL